MLNRNQKTIHFFDGGGVDKTRLPKRNAPLPLYILPHHFVRTQVAGYNIVI
jgi:hypothetical protein